VSSVYFKPSPPSGQAASGIGPPSGALQPQVKGAERGEGWGMALEVLGDRIQDQSIDGPPGALAQPAQPFQKAFALVGDVYV